PPLWPTSVVTDTCWPSKPVDCTRLRPCLANTGRTVFSTSARSAYLLRKCGFAAFLAAFSISACAAASEAKSSGVALSVCIIALLPLLLLFLLCLLPPVGTTHAQHLAASCSRSS